MRCPKTYTPYAFGQRVRRGRCAQPIEWVAVREDHLRYQGWQVVGGCAVGAFFATVPLHAFGMFLKPLCDHFSWSREAASSAYGALTIGSAISAPWVGRALDRYGARRIIL